MKVIFRRTLEETLRIIPVILVIAAGAVAGVVLGKASAVSGVPVFNYYANACLIKQHVAVFFLVNGAVLMALVSNMGSGLIANEVHEGTLRILAAKPNSRMTILAAKILGMLVGTAILLVMSLMIMFACEIATGSFDGNIAAVLLHYLPAYLIYGAIVTFFFSSLSVLLSTIMKRKILALLPMLFIILMTLGLPIIIRVTGMISRTGGLTVPVLVDMNYHYGLIFKWCCNQFGGISGTSSQLDVVSVLMNIFTTVSTDADLVRGNSGTQMVLENNALPALAVMVVYLVLAVINYIGSFLVIRKKNV